MCRLCGSHSDEEDKFWVSYIGNIARLVLLCIYTYVCIQVQCDMCPKWYHVKCIQRRCGQPFSVEIAKNSNFISACCSTDGQFKVNNI